MSVIFYDPCPICGLPWASCPHPPVCGPGYRGAFTCGQCSGEGQVPDPKRKPRPFSLQDPRGNWSAYVACPRCKGSGVDPLRVAK